MERPLQETVARQRHVTGEITYLDEMRKLNEFPKPFSNLSDMAIQMYEAEAALYSGDNRPDIMDDYKKYDAQPSQVVASCHALADQLLKLKEPDSPMTFVDVVVEADSVAVIAKLRTIAAGSILAKDDEQLAIQSDGSYYPILDIRKAKVKLLGVGLRIWGWDFEKTRFTNEDDEQYTYPQNVLVYPSDEKNTTRQIELSFGYHDDHAGGFSESVSLYLSGNGSASISSQILVSAYAETGYEGHGGSSLDNLTDDDIAMFGDLIAEIIGDQPRSIAMQIKEELKALSDQAVNPSAQQAIQDLVKATWPAQAHYLLTRKLKDSNTSIASLLGEEASVEAGIHALKEIITKWNS